VVQGVGFRPFVQKLAAHAGLRGATFNTSAGLVVELDTNVREDAVRFADALRAGAPSAARIESCTIDEIPALTPFPDFRIVASPPRDAHFTLTAPDLATCPECRAEIADPAERRFQYSFTNCTNCGPRYSITRSTPYDRANTTMAAFTLCADCAAEYADPTNRRFHAEPVACPVCGPRLSAPLADAIEAIEQGKILAIKGLGGFQLVCDAHSGQVVRTLRTRKRRSRKPFAVMMRDLETVARYCQMDEASRSLLCSSAAPIVLLPLERATAFPPELTAGLTEIGVMLPYTPLHHLLFTGALASMVMTSGNISEEPIVIHNHEAEIKLASLADQLLMHDREIFMRVDDSVARVFEGVPRMLRRARGYAPAAIRLHRELPEVLATGAELKNTFCLTKGAYAIPSQHIGDLENFETLQFFEESLRNLQAVYQSRPQLIVHDQHPDYLTSRWTFQREEPKLAVQHHHAHIASCMAENGLAGRVIGVAWDGAGLGTDGQVWGGEFLLCDYHGFERAAHLRYVALPGGDLAARQAWRMAAAHLHDAFGPGYRRQDLPCWSAATTKSWDLLDRVIEKPAIQTSSCGRLFDAVSAVCGYSLESSFEGESAMLLEAAARNTALTLPLYPIGLDQSTCPWTIDARAMLRAITADVTRGMPPESVARCFHDSLAHMIETVCCRLRERYGVDNVCLSGGVFQNCTLVACTVALLRRAGFHVFLHSQVPANDGGISLGQALIGAAYLERSGIHVPRDSR
jgi:hydrogenase maturation protein HypF